MLSLLLAIFFTACIFLAFKSFRVFKMDSLHAIIVNYFTCVLAGVIFLHDELHLLKNFSTILEWLPYAVILGALFIYTFFRMSRTAQEISVASSSMASKLALIFPVLFSMIIIQRAVKGYDWINYLGIAMTIPALVLASWPDKNFSTEKIKKHLSLPLSVFLLSGIIDTSLNFSNAGFEHLPSIKFLPHVIFLIAASIGLIYILVRPRSQKPLEIKSVIGGIYLGIPNFFSLFFLLEALREFNQDGSFIFPFVNLGTILVSAIGAFILFRESLNKLQIIGLILSIAALFFLAWQEFFEFIYG